MKQHVSGAFFLIIDKSPTRQVPNSRAVDQPRSSAAGTKEASLRRIIVLCLFMAHGAKAVSCWTGGMPIRYR